MMSEPKPIASLSSMLLARKGHASPAMRRQNMMAISTPNEGEAQALDDLGWNDMGDTTPVEPSNTGGFAGLSPMAASPGVAPEHAQSSDSTGHDAPIPAVVQQQRELLEEFEPPTQFVPPAPLGATVHPAAPAKTVTRAAAGLRGKAAFTLRLDADRHLKLRLVCAINHKSAQQIVTQALDAFLATQSVSTDLITHSSHNRGTL
jgi:hypothetical protein